jgi:hypothetical protein
VAVPAVQLDQRGARSGPVQDHGRRLPRKPAPRSPLLSSDRRDNRSRLAYENISARWRSRARSPPGGRRSQLLRISPPAGYTSRKAPADAACDGKTMQQCSLSSSRRSCVCFSRCGGWFFDIRYGHETETVPSASLHFAVDGITGREAVNKAIVCLYIRTH